MLFKGSTFSTANNTYSFFTHPIPELLVLGNATFVCDVNFSPKKCLKLM